MKLLFLGTPALAVPFLEVCRAGHEVAAVLSQPDKPSGRRLEIRPTPVKEAALAAGLKVLQPDGPSSAVEELRALGADVGVAVAYGRMLKPDLLAVPRLGFINVHFSLLPRYRGAAPVQWALLNGDSRTGVTIFWIERELDSGPVQRQASLDVGPDEDSLGLFQRLVALGVSELREALADIAAGRVRREPQSGTPVPAPKVRSDLSLIDLSAMSARQAHDRVRGLRAGPKAYLQVCAPGRPPFRLTLLKTSVEDPDLAGRPGEILRVERAKGILIQCRVGRIWLLEVQPEGKRQIFSVDFLNGARLRAGDLLGAVAQPGRPEI